MKSNQIIQEFLQRDTDKLAELIEKYPEQIPIPVLSQWWGCNADTLREALVSQGLLGIAERKSGKLNRGFVVPTGQFVRWYMCAWHF